MQRDREFVIEGTAVPPAVVAAIRAKFPNEVQFEQIMAQLTYSATLHCYSFYHAGMFHGVEHDGDIHT